MKRMFYINSIKKRGNTDDLYDNENKLQQKQNYLGNIKVTIFIFEQLCHSGFCCGFFCPKYSDCPSFLCHSFVSLILPRS